MFNVEDSRFKSVRAGAPIEVLEMCRAFKQDPNTDKKVNLSVGGYEADDGKGGHDFKVVKRIELDLAKTNVLYHGYLPALGWPEVNDAALKLLFGKDHQVITEMRAFCAQSIGGTGPIRVAAEFMNRHLGYTNAVYSDPTWMNHKDIFERAGFTEVKSYPYWNPKSSNFDFDSMLNCIKSLPENTVVILHAAAHNPTGIDPTKEEWMKICQVMKDKKLMPFFDCAYQGFATGDLDADAWAVRYFADQGLEMFVSQSFGKNMSLYGERIGFLSGVVADSKLIRAIVSQLTLTVRPMYSNPAGHGARIVGRILTDPELFEEWTKELKDMAKSVQNRRTKLKSLLDAKAPGRDWSGITKQIGMFFYSGLTEAQGHKLMTDYHIYILPSSGRINLGALTSDKIEYVASAIAKVVK